MKRNAPFMPWRFLIVIIGLVFIFSCKNNDKKAEEQEESVSPPVVSEQTEIKTIFSNPVVTDWFAHLQRTDSTLKTTGFRISNNDSIKTATPPESIADEEWNTYQPFFFYAPNRSQAIDIYSYGTIPVDQKNGSVKLEGGEPDNAVYLVNVAQRNKLQLLFSGPGTVYQKAAWLNDSVLIITGKSDANEQNTMLPVIWQINLHDSTLETISYLPGADSAISP